MAIILASDSRSRTRFRRILTILLSGFGLASLAIGFWLYSRVRLALPQLDGKLSVAGLTSAVVVIRDSHGFPTITASNFEDLFFVQGYVTAADRWFQMDGMRRAAAGDLSEIVGESQLEHDRRQRILGLRATAKRTLEIASPEDRSYFQAYARGVNAYRESHRNRLPMEFAILRYAPAAWTVEDSVLIGEYMVEDLSTSPRHQLTREKILAKLGPELTADLYVNSSSRDRLPTLPPPTPNQKISEEEEDAESPGADFGGHPTASQHSAGFALPSLPGELFFLRNQMGADALGEELAFYDSPRVLGSNNWVVSGAHTLTGKPLLSNDMHLGHQMPNLWFAAHLRCGNFDVAGVTLPGYPYVIVGHNQHIAWGFTNLGPTVEDVYIETFNSAGQYLTPEGW